MGANFAWGQMTAKEIPEVKREFTDLQAELLHRYGHDAYAGHLGIVDGLSFVIDRTFASVNEANEWVADNTRKYGPAKAVRVGEGESMVWWVGAWCPE